MAETRALRIVPAPVQAPALIAARGLTVRVEGGDGRALIHDVDVTVAPNEVLAVVGPSGVGKSTFLRCLNRLIDLVPVLRVEGEVMFRGRSIRGPEVDSDELRVHIGMLFQQPVVFPRSILANTVFGARRVRRVSRREVPLLAEEVLAAVGLWDEVKDRLGEAASCLSVGQQQRLCLARTLAVGPDVLLMDEPTSALDARATAGIEALIESLCEHHAIVLVTHDLAQARRVADRVACFALRDGAGTIVAVGAPDEVVNEIIEAGVDRPG